MNKTYTISALALGAMATATAGLAVSSNAWASEKCTVAEADYQPMETLRSELEAKGWTISELELDDGCYEAEAIDENGQEVEAYFNPATFEVVELEVEK